MKLKFLVVSDTHVGESTSLLCFPQGRQRLWETLNSLLGPSVEVEDLILLGDIPDRTLSSTSQITTHTNELMRTLGSAIDVKHVVYVPGNHDHTIWTAYQNEVHGQTSGSTGLSGEDIVKAGAAVSDKPAVRDILSIFFGYPSGSAWRSVVNRKKLDVTIANPVYAQPFNGRTYLFAHGTHFRVDVSLPTWLKRTADLLGIDELLGGLEIEPGKSPADAKSLQEMESFVAPFVDTLWPSSGDNPTSRSDQLWYVLTAISGKFGHKRPAPATSGIFPSDKLTATPSHQVRRLLHAEGGDGSLERAQQHFLPLARKATAQAGLPRPMTFVYGDTHSGGFADLPGDEMRVYNTGAWVVHNKEDHPPCHIFAVDTAGQEYLLDVSFKEVSVGRKMLLDVAAQDAEHRKDRVSRLLRFALNHLPTPG
jgi:hypothetical protein